MFSYETKTINEVNVTLLAVNVVTRTAVYYARGPLHDYYIHRRSERRFDVESYDNDWIDEASTLEDACKIIMEVEEGLVPW